MHSGWGAPCIQSVVYSLRAVLADACQVMHVCTLSCSIDVGAKPATLADQTPGSAQVLAPDAC